MLTRLVSQQKALTRPYGTKRMTTRAVLQKQEGRKRGRTPQTHHQKEGEYEKEHQKHS
jgi:hypothetical protein